MHFRERGQIVQIIRTKYDSDSKKGKNEIVGRLSKANPQLTEALEKTLSAEERTEVTAWIHGNATVDRLKRELAARMLTEQLHLAGEWFKNQKGENARVLAASLVPAWVRLRTTMKKNGLIE